MTTKRDPRQLPNAIPRRMTIAGAGGGKSSRSGGSEAPDSLKSRQVAKLVDLLSEGPIRGLVGGAAGVFLDGTSIMKPDGSMNFQNVSIQMVNGWPDQPIMAGFEAQSSEQPVSIQIINGVPQVRTIINTDVDRTRITMSVPQLQTLEDDGDIKGAEVTFRVECQAAGGGFQHVGDYTISGKTTSLYQRSIMFVLPSVGPWDIRVSRLTADSTSSKLQNDLYWDSYTEIIDDRVSYSHSACVGTMIDAEQFATIPKRTYLVDGLLVHIPSNYNPDTATYTGTWDGIFAFDWTNNPAWVFYDLVVNNRYGIGDFITADMVDRWSIYRIGQYCDQMVQDGKGGHHRRYTCNVQVQSQAEAFDLLQQFASIFRGATYWTGGQLVTVADMPADPVMQFTNANVLDGTFSYSGSDLRGRHTVASTAWNDPAFLGEGRLAVVENQERISRFGMQQSDLVAVGCTNEAQAIRTGKWALYTEEYESEVVQFTAGLEAAWCRPGDIIQVADVNVAGKRTGGRVLSASTVAVQFDQPPAMSPGGTITWLSCLVGADSHVETRAVYYSGATAIVATNQGYPPFSEAPLPDTVWVINYGSVLEPTLWRVMGARQDAPDKYTIGALRHLPAKWDFIERNIALTQPDVSDIRMYPAAVTGISIVEYMAQTSPISVGVFVTLSWISQAPQHDVWYRQPNNNWQHVRTDTQAVDLQVSEGVWTFQVTPVSSLGFKGLTSTIQEEIIGRFAAPAAPTQFRINVLDSVAHFDWLPAIEIDVIIGGHFELRHSSRTSGATWNTAQVVIPSVPGTATSVETGYQVGTWFLRTFDIVGIPSPTSAVVIALVPDGRYQQYIRVCENPDWLGSRHNTEVLEPQRWLVIGETGGLWDAQTDPMDDWPAVDLLPDMGEPAEPYGTYDFHHSIDAGAPFAVRLSADILAVPFAEGDAFIDSRMIPVDEWEDWDDVDADLAGQVTILVRSTLDDPDDPAAVWSAWQVFISGEHYARAWEFQAVLTAPAGQNIGVEELCILADLRNKIEEGADIVYPAASTRVTFRVKFYMAPSVVLTVQEAEATDNIQIVAKTREYFDIEIKDNSGVHQVRTFDYHAVGF